MSPPRNNKRWIALAVFVLVIVALYFFAPQQLSLASLAKQEAILRQTYQQHPALFLIAAFFVYVTITGLSLPGAAVLSLTYGWLFGFWVALPLVSFASTLGASLAFLSSRYFLRDWVQARYQRWGEWLDKSFAKDGWFFLLTLRMVPQFPFFVVNLLMGLTPISLTTFWWASQLGMLPATCVFLFAGASSPSLQKMADEGISSLVQPQWLLGLALLGILPLLLRWLFSRSSPSPP